MTRYSYSINPVLKWTPSNMNSNDADDAIAFMCICLKPRICGSMYVKAVEAAPRYIHLHITTCGDAGLLSPKLGALRLCFHTLTTNFLKLDYNSSFPSIPRFSTVRRRLCVQRVSEAKTWMKCVQRKDRYNNHGTL